ncbi:MAG TPA: ATP-binding protein [Woeseiaceae bacterium]|nr:ATP-binding protein [Woeseiaceae bacterium]
MSEDLRHSLVQRIARLEAALALTAGTVHDVNNVLTVLSGNLFLLTESVRDQPELYEQARRARNAAERGSTLLRELLTYGRDADDETRAINPADHVAALQPLLARAIGGDHELTLDVDHAAGSVDASAAQLESVLINLAINACDALSRRGKVRISVQAAEVDGRQPAPGSLARGSYVRIEVADNGCGIPQEHLARVTEPLFSTKPPDRGSGLGLSMVKRFAEKSDGALAIHSAEGRGTRVQVWLPRSGRLAETTANMTLPLSTLPGGDESIVLVSRDADVRASLQQILEALGYTVRVAGNPEQVEALLAQPPAPALLIAERSADAANVERRWLQALREVNGRLRHVALLQPGANPAEAAADADSYLYRPVNVLALAKKVRSVLEV